MSIVYGESRCQGMMLPECVEDWVSAENPVRVIDAFVEGLELGRLKLDWATESSGGRPAYDPRALLKLYIYGSLNRIRSSRDLEKSTCRNLEVLWLMRRLQPDHWTINEFRKRNPQALKALFREFHLVCAKLELVLDSDVVALDSAFFKAVNNPAKNFTQGKVRRWLKEIDQKSEAYLAALGQVDENHPRQPGAQGNLSKKLEVLNEKRAEAEKLLEAMEKSPTGQISMTDPDARLLSKPGEKVVGYQVQIAVEAANHLIIAQDTMLSGQDPQALVPMGKATAEALGREGVKLLCDTGYYSLPGAAECEARGIEVHVPVKIDSQKEGGPYGLGAFRYDPQTDCLICPHGQALHRQGDTHSGANPQKVYANIRACRDCPVRPQCTRGQYRKIKLSYHLELKRTLKARQQADRQQAPGSPPGPTSQRRRASIVEHVFGTLKFWMGTRALLTRRHQSVSGEIALSCLAYNFKRVLTLVPVPRLLDLLTTSPTPIPS